MIVKQFSKKFNQKGETDMKRTQREMLKLFRDICFERNINMDVLAEEFGVSRQSLYNWIRQGQVPEEREWQLTKSSFGKNKSV